MFSDSVSPVVYGNEIRRWDFSCTKGFSSYNPRHGIKTWSFFHKGSPRLNANYPGMEEEVEPMVARKLATVE